MRLKTITLCILTLASLWVNAQTVTTITEGTPDDAIALDSNGNIYASNYVGDTVFKFTPSGDMFSFVTGLNTPNGLAFNSNDELYVCDGQGNTIYKYDIDGNELESFPVTSHPSGIIKSPDSDDMIFTRYTGNTINRLEPDGTITLISDASELNGPVGLAYDENGVLYVGNYNDREIYRVLSNGDLEYIAQLPTDGGSLPNLGFITYGQGKIWGTTMGSHKIYHVNPDEVDDYTLFAGSVAGGADGDISVATFNIPNGILFDNANNTLYITDFGPKNLRIITDVILGVGESELLNSNLRLSPNPAQDNLFLTGTLTEGSYKVELYNVAGQLLSTMSITSVGNEISEAMNISNLVSGVYFVKISDGSNSLTKRMIKK